MGNCCKKQEDESNLTQCHVRIPSPHGYTATNQPNQQNNTQSWECNCSENRSETLAKSDVDLTIKACKFLEHILVKLHGIPQSNAGLGEKIKVAKEQQIISADINNRLWRLNEQRNELAHTFDKDSLVSRRRFMNDFSTVVATLNRRRNMSAQLLSRYREILNYDNN